MSAELQTALALLLVVLAAVYLVRASVKRRRGGGSDCGGCGPDKFKASLKR